MEKPILPFVGVDCGDLYWYGRCGCTKLKGTRWFGATTQLRGELIFIPADRDTIRDEKGEEMK